MEQLNSSVAHEKPTTMSERRNEIRTPTDELVDVYQDDKFIATVHLENLSESGAFLCMDNAPFKIGDNLDVRLPLPRQAGQTGKALYLRAVVVRETKTGAGLMITNKAMVSLQSSSDIITL